MSEYEKIKVTLLAGGVGGAKMAEGFANLSNVDLTVICNVADDDEFHGLWVSPDVDTMAYTLSNRIDRDKGWGVADEGLRALNILSELGQDTWMTLGDKDLGLHIFRTLRLKQGASRQEVTDELCRSFKVPARLVLATEDVVQTRVRTPEGWLSFQEYFVREQCRPDVLDLAYEGACDAQANEAAIEAISKADIVVIAPSNPLMSIEPILQIGGIKAALANAKAPRIAVSPFVGGKALKGPADRMLRSLGHEPSTSFIANHYKGLIDTLVVEHTDVQTPFIDGVRIEGASTVMSSLEIKTTLAERLIELCQATQLSGSAA